MVQRSPFLTQLVALSRSRRSLCRVMITSPALAVVAVGEFDLGGGCGAGEAVGAGALVEFGDEFAGGGEHDAVAAVRRGRWPRR